MDLQRKKNIENKFISIYGKKNQHFVKAPGRVNLIGQHIDYQGYGVLPFAINKSCVIALSHNNSHQINVNHIHPDIYPSFKLPVDPFQQIQYNHNYQKYFHAGYRAGLLNLNLPLQNHQFVGLDILIQGNIPLGSGLSSSSALIVAAAVVSSFANKFYQGLDKFELVDNCIRWQRTTGTASGGMDQTVSYFAQQEYALKIDFNPLRCEKIKLPHEVCFILANSLTSSFKLETLAFRYNKRVCECRVAAVALAKLLGLKQLQNIKILKDVQQRLGYSLDQMDKLVEEKLQRREYSFQELQNLLGMKLADVLNDIQKHQIVLDANKTFKIYHAAKHVYNQTLRVQKFVNVCKQQPNPQQSKLMDQSHTSCKQLYQCSSKQLDQLVELAKSKGALGARLTGAGWGGYCVIMTQTKQSERLFEELKQYYLQKNVSIQQNLIMSKPQTGVQIIQNK